MFVETNCGNDIINDLYEFGIHCLGNLICRNYTEFPSWKLKILTMGCMCVVFAL